MYIRKVGFDRPSKEKSGVGVTYILASDHIQGLIFIYFFRRGTYFVYFLKKKIWLVNLFSSGAFESLLVI